MFCARHFFCSQVFKTTPNVLNSALIAFCSLAVAKLARVDVLFYRNGIPIFQTSKGRIACNLAFSQNSVFTFFGRSSGNLKDGKTRAKPVFNRIHVSHRKLLAQKEETSSRKSLFDFTYHSHGFPNNTALHVSCLH